MSIIIKTEKIIVRGEQKRRITSVSALRKEELPSEYTEGESVYFFTDDIDLHNSNEIGGNYFLTSKTTGAGKESILSEAEFHRRLEIVKRCGNRLQEINARLKKENEGWHGEETFVI